MLRIQDHSFHPPADTPLMRVRLLILLACLVASLAPSRAGAADLVLVQSSALAPYEEARAAIEAHWAQPRALGGVKSIAPISLAVFLLTDYPSLPQLAQKIREERPRAVLAIGREALAFCREQVPAPVVYLLAPEGQELAGARRDILGVSLKIDPVRQLAALGRALPGVQTIGALYSPQHSGAWVKEALLSPVADVQTLLFRKIDASTDFARALAGLGGSIQAYWLLPDQLAATPETVRHLLHFSFARQIPIIAFSEKYLSQGAALAITFDIPDLGRQAAELAGQIAGGADPATLPALSPPRLVRVVANLKILARMGITVNQAEVTAPYLNGDTDRP